MAFKLFRFSLRTLFLGVLVFAAVGTVWWRWAPWAFERTYAATGAAPVQQICFSPDDAYIAALSDNKVMVWSLRRNAEQAVVKTEGPRSIAFSPDSTRLLLVDDNGARICNVANGADVAVLEPPSRKKSRTIFKAGFSPDGERVVGGLFDGVVVWDARTGKHVTEILRTDINIPRAALFLPDGISFLVAATEETIVFNTAGEELWKLPGGREAISFSADGKRMISSTGYHIHITDLVARTDTVHDCEAMGMLTRINGAYASWVYPRFLPQSSLVAVEWVTSVQVIDLEKDVLLYTLPDTRISSFECTPDGKRLLTLSDTINVWSVDEGAHLARIEPPESKFNTFALSHDGRRFAALCDDGRVQIYAKRRDENVTGAWVLPELWLTFVLAVLLVWSLWRTNRQVTRMN